MRSRDFRQQTHAFARFDSVQIDSTCMECWMWRPPKMPAQLSRARASLPACRCRCCWCAMWFMRVTRMYDSMNRNHATSSNVPPRSLQLYMHTLAQASAFCEPSSLIMCTCPHRRRRTLRWVSLCAFHDATDTKFMEATFLFGEGRGAK